MKQFVAALVFVLVTDVDEASQPSNSFCHTVKSNGDNLRYCNITTTWKSRLSNAKLITTLALFSVASGISCLYILLKVAPQKHANYCRLLEIKCCCKILCFPVYVVLPIFSLLWDVIDILIDVYTFEQLERGKIIDSVIYRNVYVNNAILVFTILGVLKMFLIMWLFLRSHKFFQINKKEDLANIKRGTVLLTFLAEDGIQLFLEYFYISKYFTDSPRIFLIYRDIVAALLAICAIQLNLNGVFNETDKFRRILFGILVLIGITELLRMFAVIDQCVDLKLHRNCFNVFQGKLLQTPFTTSCLKNIDYAILVLGLISLAASVYLLVIPLKMLSLLKKVDYEEKQQVVQRENAAFPDYNSIDGKLIA